MWFLLTIICVKMDSSKKNNNIAISLKFHNLVMAKFL